MFFFQAEDGIRDLVRSRGLGDVYKRQVPFNRWVAPSVLPTVAGSDFGSRCWKDDSGLVTACLLYTSDAADERSSVDLGGRRIIKKKKER